MELNKYQEESLKTALYPSIGGVSFVYPALGLAGESGEVSEKIKKLFRDKNGVVDEAFINDIKKELGDVLWYLSALSHELNISLEDVARTNIEKLKSRELRNKLHGDGDNR